MRDLDHAPKDGRVPATPRKAVSQDRLIELIQARVKSKLYRLAHIPVPIPIRIRPNDGGTNWKIDVVAGVPPAAFNEYMAVVRELMGEYELTAGRGGDWA